VVVGESDGVTRWLYFNAGVIGDGVGFESMLGKRPYSPPELAAIARNVKALTALANKNQLKFLIAVCPDKQTVHSEYLPKSMRPAPGTLSRLDQFWAMARGLDGVPLVDLRPPLRAAKATFPVYFPTDTHWNQRGAFIAYETIAQALQLQDPSREPIPAESVQWKPSEPLICDLTKMLGVPSSVAVPYLLPVVPSQLPIKRQGKLLILGDSFSNFLLPHFERQFATVKKIHGVWPAGVFSITQEMLNAEKPDVVILESLERYWTM
ncbi:MAG TPA: hypothetical protein VF518_07705, partial [Polyangia bacterium]